ncbi:MAG: CAP domain-containing protein, partial [Ignavibacteriaceae bacterium]|nr:CAP domain-containing protein [Ignavibacteriaceae bacterium]
MKKRFLKYTLTFFLLFLISVSCEENPVSNNESNPSNNVEQEVHQLINSHRTGIGLAPLEWNETIATECRNHSIEMANAHTINHDGFYDRVNKIKETIPWSWAGENVAYNYSA